MARTRAEWEARAVELIELADDLVTSAGSDAASFGSRISAYARLSHAISKAIEVKVIK